MLHIDRLWYHGSIGLLVNNDLLLCGLFAVIYHQWQWWSLETWSQSQDQCLHVSVLKVSVLILVSKATWLATLNIAEKWFSKTV